MGGLPNADGWVRLEIPAAAVGLESANIQGMSFCAYNGKVTWDRVGKSSRVSGLPPTSDPQPPGVVISEPATGATISEMLNAVAKARAISGPAA